MSKEADEIANKIFEACSPRSRFHRDMVAALHSAEIKTGDGYEIISSSIADELIKLGYVKVVRCCECEWWEKWPAQNKRHNVNGLELRLCGQTEFYTNENEYCGKGERKEGSDG